MLSRTELVAVIAEKAEVSKKDAEAVLKVLKEIIIFELAHGGEVQVGGLGTFRTKLRTIGKKGDSYVEKELLCPTRRVVVFEADDRFRKLQ